MDEWALELQAELIDDETATALVKQRATLPSEELVAEIKKLIE